MITHNKSIAVFDSGLGSLSVIRGLRSQISKENIIYYADKKNFPYGQKSVDELEQIMVETVSNLSSFDPKLIVVASITPSIQMLSKIKSMSSIPILGVSIPLKEASRLTKKKHIGILGTRGTIMSKELDEQIKLEVPQDIFVTKFDASELIEIVEKGLFLKDEDYTIKTISRSMANLKDSNLDVLILSSTHLSFIRSHLESVYPSVRIIDSAINAVREIRQFLKSKNILRKNGLGRMRIIVNGDKDELQETLKEMGLSGSVESFQKE
ncbi:MAG TPA: glutamate racemase [Nitrososphaeraceae archaeon]|nr:glutamate racemase [Nitrososphaeraceae archaeon]